jgi:hypothetical protein
MPDDELIKTLRIAANATNNKVMVILLNMAANRLIKLTDYDDDELTTIPVTV